MKSKNFKKNILFVSNLYPPNPAIGSRRIVKFTKFLYETGWNISVLTVRQDTNRADFYLKDVPDSARIYRTGIIDPFQILITFRSILKKMIVLGKRSKNKQSDSNQKNIEPASSTRAPIGFFPKISDLIYQFLNYPDKLVGWVPKSFFKGIRILFKDKINIIFSSGPPYTNMLLGYLLARIFRLPLVLDFRDPWTRSDWESNLFGRSFFLKLDVILERIIVEWATLVILNTEKLKENFEKYYPEAFARKFVCITNGYDRDDFPQIFKETNSHIFRITHAGTLYHLRDPSYFILACKQLIDEGKINPTRFELTFLGDISPELRFGLAAKFDTKELSWLKFLPPVSFIESQKFLGKSNALLIIQPGTSLQIPAKLFDYIVFRKPILALAHEGALHDIVVSHALGTVVIPEDFQGIKQVLCDWYKKSLSGTLHFDLSPKVLSRFDMEAISQKLNWQLKKIY